ncbi:MAG: DUF2341 domain-containing protein [Candidatus Methanospirareceae archaeon]
MTYIPRAGLTWEEIKSKLETEGSLNKQYDLDADGLVENIRFKSVAKLPATPRDYEVVVHENVLKVYDPVKSRWCSIKTSIGYDGFDNNGGGVWLKYINIPITTTPSEYAQYKIVIDSNNVTVYSVDGTQKTQGAVASDFWANVKSDGSDIRLFDQAKSQFYFWIEEWDYSNKQAEIKVKLEAGSTELNIAYSNPSATKSNYENGEQVFEFFDDFEGTELDTTKWDTSQAANAFSIENGLLKYVGDGTRRYLLTKDTWSRNYAFFVKAKSNVDFQNWGVWYLPPYYGLGSNPGTGYWLAVRTSPNGWSIGYTIGDQGITSTLASSTALSNDASSWYRATLILTPSEVKGTLENLATGEIDSLSATDTTYTDSRQFGVSGRELEGDTTYFDYVYVAKLADPAKFGTPQIVEF